MTQLDFSRSRNTVVVSDIHLADVEDPGIHHHLWKQFKTREHLIDQDFAAFLKEIQRKSKSPIELVFNGDIFDFDSVMVQPVSGDNFQSNISWIERLRGLNAEEEKSRFKFKVILDTHPVWINEVRSFILAGNRVIFVIGNHDLELHWPAVQHDFLERLNLTQEFESQVRFCEWFYISNQDTLIEHGNQYDAYCLCSNPVHPLIKMGTKSQIRMPFGNLAGKYMTNGMGFINPHATESFIKSSVWEYVVFYFKYVFKTQPFLIWTWFWSAMITLIYSLVEGFLPAMRDPLTVDSRLQEIADRSNATVPMVLALKEVHVHPAIFNPIKIMRELWLDRALLLGTIFFISFQFFSFLNIFLPVSVFWIAFPMLFLVPAFILYARNVESEVEDTQRAAFRMAPLSAQVAKVRRIVQGHTHHEDHRLNGGVEVLNTGTWSAAFHDVECTQPYGKKCFAWIRYPELNADHRSPRPERVADLYEWVNHKAVLIPGRHQPVQERASFNTKIQEKVLEETVTDLRSLIEGRAQDLL